MPKSGGLFGSAKCIDVLAVQNVPMPIFGGFLAVQSVPVPIYGGLFGTHKVSPCPYLGFFLEVQSVPMPIQGGLFGKCPDAPVLGAFWRCKVFPCP